MVRANRVMAWILIGIGVALLVETAVIRGGSVGYLGGAAFVALGVIRLRAAR